MKTLVNKNNTAIKIITDTLLSDSFNYITGFCSVPKSDWTLVPIDWTLVEEEFPKIIPDEKMEPPTEVRGRMNIEEWRIKKAAELGYMTALRDTGHYF